MAERRSTEADDVFEFLESLPQTGKGGSEKAKASKKIAEGKNKSKNDDDIMDFLDELEKSNLSLNKKSQDAEKLEKEKKEPAKEKVVEQPKQEEAQQGAQEELQEENEREEQSEEPLKDPITSISKWWSTSGSATVSNFWNKTTEQASSITTKLTQEQLDLSSKLSAGAITELARNLQKMVAGETDEVLRIHLVHDLVNFSQLQYNVEQKFDQVLSSQVQGGIRIFVDQWGHPHKSGSGKDDSLTRTTTQHKLNIFSGKIADGEKLAFANLDNAIKLFDKAHEEYMKQQKESQDHSEDDSNAKDRISDIFMSILPIAVPGNHAKAAGDIITTDAVHAGNFSFTIILKDISNDVSTITRSQGFPMKWVGWLEGESDWKPKREWETSKSANDEDEDDEEIVDPGDWVREWIEDGLTLSLGVVAQNYVIERMGF